MTKRIRSAVLPVLLSLTLATGCPTAQQWISIISSLLPIIGQTYLQFYGFTQKGGVGADDIQKVQTLTSAGQDALNQISSLMKAYESAPSTALLQQMQAVIAQAQKSIGNFLADAGIKNSAKLTQYTQFTSALLADLSDVLNLIPTLAGPAHARISANAKTYQGIFEARLAALKAL